MCAITVYERTECAESSSVNKPAHVDDDDANISHVQYFCACKCCHKVYMYKAADGSNFGTKNLLDHVKNCAARAGQPKGHLGQMSIQQCLINTPRLSKIDLARLKRKEVEYVVSGFHSFRAVENPGLLGLLQTCVDIGLNMAKLTSQKALLKEIQFLEPPVHCLPR
jgi:hypothetical protein